MKQPAIIILIVISAISGCRPYGHLKTPGINSTQPCLAEYSNESRQQVSAPKGNSIHGR